MLNGWGSKRGIVTLLACIPCAKLGAFVMCADSQETVEEFDANGASLGSYRRTVQKIKPLNISDLQVVIAGSGNSNLIEAFIELLRRALLSQPCKSMPEFVNLVELKLIDFYRDHVPLAEDKTMALFIGCSLKSTHEIGAWIQTDTILIPIVEPVLEGWRETLYVKILERLCAGDLTKEQAVLAGVYVLKVAEASSNYVREPMSVVVIDSEGIHEVPQEYVHDVADRLAEYERSLNRLFLACADTRVATHELEESIEEFKATVVALHRHDIDQQAEKTSLGDLLRYNPLQTLPPGPIAFGTKGFSIEHDREKIKQAIEQWKQAREWHAEMTTRVHCECGHDFDVPMPRKMGVQSRKALCPKCGKENSVTRVELGPTTI
jgi:hypothetical protein